MIPAMKKGQRKSFAVSTGRRLAVAREAAGISQAELARRLEISAQRLSNWENGAANVPGEFAPKIFLLTRIDSNYLYQGDLSQLSGRMQDAIREIEARDAPQPKKRA